MAAFSALQWLDIVGHELLLFAAVWFAIGSLDELVIDATWIWLRLTGRAGSAVVDMPADAPLRGVAAVLVPAWRESAVIGAMIAHSLKVWPQRDLRIYAGCYRNDAETLAALIGAAPGDPRLRIVVLDHDGPTTKADCLNRLHAALGDDERRCGFTARSVILQDAEDMVHPAGLVLLDRGLDTADFVQLPVRPELQAGSRWIAGHYGDEFAESHGKTLVVRDWLGTGLPAAGVGCAFSRRAIRVLALRRGSAHPFAAECLTEDYECGLLITEAGGKGRFLRYRDGSGNLVATREFFPATLPAAVRQKTRWLHGIAFQGWDRLGWNGSVAELWMRTRDRRGPLIAIVLSAAYLLVMIWPIILFTGSGTNRHLSNFAPLLAGLLVFNLASLLWRCVFRFGFTAREYGWREGLIGLLRMPVGNIIAIMAGRRALVAYLRTLSGGSVTWEKTEHRFHPALPGAV